MSYGIGKFTSYLIELSVTPQDLSLVKGYSLHLKSASLPLGNVPYRNHIE